MCPFKHDGIGRQVFLVHTAKQTQEVAESSPDAFLGIAVDLTETVTVIVAGILVMGMANGGVVASRFSDVIVG